MKLTIEDKNKLVKSTKETIEVLYLHVLCNTFIDDLHEEVYGDWEEWDI